MLMVVLPRKDERLFTKWEEKLWVNRCPLPASSIVLVQNTRDIVPQTQVGARSPVTIGQ